MIELLLKLIISLGTAGAGARFLADSINDKTLLVAICACAAWVVYLMMKHLFLLIEKYHKPLILLLTGSNAMLIWMLFLRR